MGDLISTARRSPRAFEELEWVLYSCGAPVAYQWAEDGRLQFLLPVVWIIGTVVGCVLSEFLSAWTIPYPLFRVSHCPAWSFCFHPIIESCILPSSFLSAGFNHRSWWHCLRTIIFTTVIDLNLSKFVILSYRKPCWISMHQIFVLSWGYGLKILKLKFNLQQSWI